MASFLTPEVHVNQVGWGPTDMPEKFIGLPFNPFSKSDRLGRAADFAIKDPRFARNRWREQETVVVNPEDEFNLVEDANKKNKLFPGRQRSFRGRWQRGRGARSFAQRRDAEAERAQQLKGKQAKYLVQHTRRGKQWRGRGRGNFQRRWNRRDTPTLETSVKVEPSWKLIDEFEINTLNKLTMTPPQATDLKWCGHLHRYDDNYERVSSRNPVKLKRFPKTVFNSATSIDDPVIQQYAQEMSGKGKVVLATDELLAHLMACPRSVLPWDLYFTRFENGLMFIDKRDDSGLEMLSVDETIGQRNQPDEKITIPACDMPSKLGIEATAINQNFSQQIINTSKRKTFDNPNPLWDEEDEEEGSVPANFAYRYRKWQLSDDITLVARTELHSYVRKTAPKKGNSYMSVFALNEANPKLSGAPSWRGKIDSSRGSVLATALKNNACKIGKWTAQTLLSGADTMKIGFVTRKTVKDPYNHEVIGTQFYNPTEFAGQINLQQNNMWAIIKGFVDMIYDQAPGKYVLLRDPNKPSLLIYQVPMNSFTEDDDEEDEEEYDQEE